MIKMEELNCKIIAKYIIENYPDSCLACNVKDYYFEDYYNDRLLEECLNFFSYDILDICSCGRPEDTTSVIKDILNIINDYDNERQDGDDKDFNLRYDKKQNRLANLCGIEINDNTNYDGLIQFVLYMLDSVNFLEHGSSIGGAWLTDLGRMFLYVLNNIEIED